MKKNLLCSILSIVAATALAVAPAFAGGAKVLSDSELQQVTAGHVDDADLAKAETNANADGVQLNDTFQKEAAGLNLENADRSANNFQTNAVMAGAQFTGDIDQLNEVSYGSQRKIGNNDGRVNDSDEADAKKYHANAGGVQLNDDAQELASGLNIANTNRSANNAQTNVVAAFFQGQGKIDQSNKVTHSQEKIGINDDKALDNDDAYAHQQEANADGVQLNDSAQKLADGLNIANTNRSANNGQTNIVTAFAQGQYSIEQSNEVGQSQYRIGTNEDWSSDRDEAASKLEANAGGVQLNDKAQEGDPALNMNNSNRSASNMQTNLVAALYQWQKKIEQSNLVDDSQIDVGNNFLAGDSDSAEVAKYHANADGVQLNDSAQSLAIGLNMSNENRSANNSQTNVVVAKEQSQGGHSFRHPGGVYQSNKVEDSQSNVGNNTFSFDMDKAVAENRRGDATEANSDGVQLNDAAQASAIALNMVNANRSANNAQTNVVAAKDQTQSIISQSNMVENSQKDVGGNLLSIDADFAKADSDARYGDGSHANADGVQLNDEAQMNAIGLNIANTNRTASNAQTNIVAAFHQHQGVINQLNKVDESQIGVGNNLASFDGDTALVFDGFHGGATEANAGGVQGNDKAQKYVVGLNVLNANRSASNFQTNVIAAFGQAQGFINQSNIVRGSQIGVGVNR